MVEGTSRIVVKMPSKKAVVLEILPSQTVEELKMNISRKEDISVELLRLHYAGQILQDNCTMSEYSLHKGLPGMVWCQVSASESLTAGRTVVRRRSSA